MGNDEKSDFSKTYFRMFFKNKTHIKIYTLRFRQTKKFIWIFWKLLHINFTQDSSSTTTKKNEENQTKKTQ